MKRAAIISECGKYRYSLSREWKAPSLGLVNWIMLNPSTADANQDDPTIRRCILFADRWGFGGIVVTNLFAYRATDPGELLVAKDPVGPAWEEHVIRSSNPASKIVVAWGNNGSFQDADSRLLSLLEGYRLWCLGVTKTGQPKHPLYIRNDQELELWGEPSRPSAPGAGPGDGGRG